ncbi:glycine cleavage system protein GcvH [Planctomycetales bacterium ZRK34]|nr:glycine cleavage system protein GcvH [Planctomycetales bacterium ZRK34]
MSVPAGLRFLDSHEWHKLDGNIVTVGVSRFAIDELTDVTYVDLPCKDNTVAAGDTIGEIESVKATSDIYTGVSGKVIEVNEAAIEDPAVVNNDPFGEGWLVKIELSDPAELDKLLDSKAYEAKFPAE